MSRTQTIWIVDDDATIRDVVRRYLELDGYRVVEIGDGVTALERLRQERADLVLLDIMLPGIDGYTLARALRHQPGLMELHGDVPIIMLTSRGSENDRLAGFDLGIDDYVVKPFSPREVAARVKAVLRRSTGGPDGSQPLTFGALTIDPRGRDVRVGGNAVSLTAREFDLLWLFARHRGQVLTREQLINQVWGFDFDGEENTVTVHIRRLREKIEPDPTNPIYIITVRGVGYKFDPE